MQPVDNIGKMKPTHEEIALAAWVIWQDRLAHSEPGDADGDWYEAEEQFNAVAEVHPDSGVETPITN